MANDHRIGGWFSADRRLRGPGRSLISPSSTYEQNRQSAGVRPPSQQQPSKIRLDRIQRSGDPEQASKAARTLSEFVVGQIHNLQRSGNRRPRPLSAPAVDRSLWFDDRRYAAWTIDGQLVVIDDPQPGEGRGSPRVRIPTNDEFRLLLAVDRVIEPVIALYRGDQLPATRYLPHFHLQTALGAALARAREFEETQIEEPPAEPSRPKIQPAKKSRHHPLGNYVVYRPAAADEDLPHFAAILPLPPVPPAFEDRREATRAIQKHQRRGHLTSEFRVARVLGSVMVRPAVRADLPRPRNVEELLSWLRRDSRVVESDLRAEWIPRFWQSNDGEWRRREFQNKRTVRNRHQVLLLEELGDVSRKVVDELETAKIRQAVGDRKTTADFDAQFRVLQRAERRLPSDWKKRIGIVDLGLGPDWRELSEQSFRATEEGHWLRAPFEFGKKHIDGLRSRTVELRINNLAELIEQFGMEIELWLVKDSTTESPRWIVSSRNLFDSG